VKYDKLCNGCDYIADLYDNYNIDVVTILEKLCDLMKTNTKKYRAIVWNVKDKNYHLKKAQGHLDKLYADDQRGEDCALNATMRMLMYLNLKFNLSKEIK
jgi:hypothetical protein